MSGNVSGKDFDFDHVDIPQIATEALRQATSVPPRDARRLVEDKLEEMRLRRELMTYELEF
ncbi:PA3496 family putative envelope integrity protein [Microbulbifer sp. 2201CG32-9]|uniref:PA3496 family putative envelope integrity protein n=1 Tax=unclassified Microbulbifer TaxID=2619833 RepID=UPI00345BB3D4